MEWFTYVGGSPGGWFGRLLFQRALALVYLTAFLSAALQFRALLGERGILPVSRFVRRVPFRRAPSVFHLRSTDGFIATWAWSGVVLSAALLLGVGDLVPLWTAMVLWALLWLMYLSIVNVGQIWYAFGWESLLLEAGFLAVFLGNERVAPPVLVLWLLRWLLFRVEFGAGLIKLRGDRCWRDLTCLYHHHETQPLPGPLSRFFHRLPRPLHRIEVAANHLAQVVVPVLLFAPQPVAGTAAVVIVVTQLWLVASGNFAWLNLLTIAVALSAFDGAWAGLFGLQRPSYPDTPAWYQAIVMVVTVGILVLSYRPVRNLLSRRQLMNASFEPLRLVNTYGAFGTVSRVRRELVIEGTDEERVTADTRWREYGFRAKPGAVDRRPPLVAPYHLRLDWMMWFAGTVGAPSGTWLEPFIARLLRGDPDTLRLLRHNPFPQQPPTHVRAVLYRYRFTDREERRTTGAWWHRTREREVIPPVTRRESDR